MVDLVHSKPRISLVPTKQKLTTYPDILWKVPRRTSSWAKTADVITSWTIWICRSFRLSRFRTYSAMSFASNRSLCICLSILRMVSVFSMTWSVGQLTSNFLFCSSIWSRELVPIGQASLCRRLSRGAPRLCSLLRLQYLQTAMTNSCFLRIPTRPIYCIILSTMIQGTTGGDDLYSFPYARAILVELATGFSDSASAASRA